MYVQGIDPSMIIPIALIVAIGIIIYKGVKIVLKPMLGLLRD